MGTAYITTACAARLTALLWQGQALHIGDHSRAGSLSLGRLVHKLASGSRPGSK